VTAVVKQDAILRGGAGELLDGLCSPRGGAGLPDAANCAG